MKTIKFVCILAISLVMATGFVYTNREFEITKNIEIFANLYRELNTNYVDDIAPGKLMKIGLDAMVHSLDPYTVYWSETQIEGYKYLTRGKYQGIGAVIKLVGDYPTIMESFEKSPAVKAGLKIGDQIISVDGQDAKGRSSEDLRSVMRGVPGSTMDLEIIRPYEKKPITVKVTRGEISVPNVPYSGMIEDHIVYISLTTFTPKAGANVTKALRNLYTEDPDLKGVILDLRSNGGGLLREAINICNIFVDKGLDIVSTRSKVKTRDQHFKTNRMPEDKDIRVAVLINNHSASASEIVSGALQDLDRAVIIGQQSFGKGLVQNTFELGYNAKAKITTSKYYIPSGRCIQAVSYHDGKPVDIPDDQRQAFKTKNGRTVLDGGGIRPDILLKARDDNPLIQDLQKNHIIFNYVTSYCSQLKTDPVSGDYTFDDWPGFLTFLEEQSYTYISPFQKKLTELSKAGDDETLSPDVHGLIVKLKDAHLKSQSEHLADARAQIIQLIEQEIIGRYHYRTGKIIQGLRDDLEIDKAVDVLTSESEYDKILNSK